MKTRRKTEVSFSDNILNLRLPQSWAELSDAQLRYVALCLYSFEPLRAKALIFFRLTGVTVEKQRRYGYECSVRLGWFKKVRFLLQEWQVYSFLHQLDWLFEPNPQPRRLACIGKREAVDALLHGVQFIDYLKCENLYQGYLYTQDEGLLKKMAEMLYPGKGRLRADKVQLVTVFLWWGAVKTRFASEFPHFFEPFDKAEQFEDAPDMVTAMNAQIRALTSGDVTKEEVVLQMDCWRALTELDAKAREIQEFKARSKAHG